MCQFFVKRGFETEKDWDEGMKYLKNPSRRYTDLLSFLKGVIGAMLSQEDDEGVEHPICFYYSKNRL